MSDSDFALRLASPAELREMVQTLTRERDEARADAARLRGDIETALEMLRDSWGEDAIAGGDDQVAVVLQRALAGEGEAPSCTWTMDEDGVWRTGCGASWIYFPGGTPDEHGQRFCHACGKSIAAAAALEKAGVRDDKHERVEE